MGALNVIEMEKAAYSASRGSNPCLIASTQDFAFSKGLVRDDSAQK